MSYEEVRKDWFDAVVAFHEHGYHSTIVFLESGHGTENGLGPDDNREFRRAVQSFGKTWRAAARVYVEGKYMTPKKFVSSGKFLKLGFAPSRDHVAVLSFAIKFYKEEPRYRQNIESPEVAAVGKYGGSIKPIYSSNKSRSSYRVVGPAVQKPNKDDGDSIPTLVDIIDISDDSSAESLSRLSDDRSEMYPSPSKTRAYAVSERYREIASEKSDFCRVLFCELSMERSERNPVDALMFFVFAVIPLLLFAKVRAFLACFLPIQPSPKKNEHIPENVEDEWNELRANALMLDDESDEY